MTAVRAAGTDPDIQEEAQKTIPLLMDDEEADDIAKRCIKACAGANTGPARGKNLLVALRDCSASAASPLVAKALARHGFGELAKQIMGNPAGVEDDESLDLKKEIMAVRSDTYTFEASIECPAGTFLLQILAMSAVAPSSAQKLRSANLFENCTETLVQMVEAGDSQGVDSTMGAGRRLLGMPTDCEVAQMHNLVVTICHAASSFLSDPSVIRNAGNFLLALGQNEETRQLLLDPEVQKVLAEAAERLAHAQQMEEKKALIALIGGVLACKDEGMSKMMLKQEGLLPTCFEVLQADISEGDAGAGALAILDGLGASDALRPKWNQVTLR